MGRQFTHGRQASTCWLILRKGDLVACMCVHTISTFVTPWKKRCSRDGLSGVDRGCVSASSSFG